MSIFTHVTVGTENVHKARAFYDAVLSTLGLTRIDDLGENGAGWGKEIALFYVLKPIDGKPASVGNGSTVSFAAPNRAAVNAFHKAALALGGKEEWPLGRRTWSATAYAAYVRDLDGNKLAVYSYSEE